MSTVRASVKTISRALLRPRLQPLPRSGLASRRTYANEKNHAQATSSGVTPIALGGVGLGVVAMLYYFASNQKDVAKSDHKGQMSYRTDEPGMHNISVKDVDTSKDPAQSDLPNDAPNNPANLDKMEQKQSQKPASKRSSPMQ